jgi:hypothetical protein
MRKEKRKPVSAPRNPTVLPMLARKADAHGKSDKAKRRADKITLHLECSSRVEHAAFNREARVRCPSLQPSPSGFAKGCFEMVSRKCSSMVERRSPNP